jgi:hypothetical protein
VLRTVPPLAWLPLSLAAFREAQPSAIFVIFITSVWPVIINTGNINIGNSVNIGNRTNISNKISNNFSSKKFRIII